MFIFCTFAKSLKFTTIILVSEQFRIQESDTRKKMSSNKTLTKIPQFDGHYDHWSELMENLLRAKGLWSLVEEGYTEPTEGIKVTAAQKRNLDKFKMKDHQVMHYLFQAFDRIVFEQILNRKTSKNIWDSMKKKFGGNERVKRSLLQTLRRYFEVLEMKNEENIDDYFGRVMVVSNKMRSNGEDMSDSKIFEKILRTLTEKFTYVVVVIEESKNTRKMTIDELQSSLFVHEKKFKKISHEEGDQALNVRGRGRDRGSYRGRGRGKGRSFNKATIECYNCHQLGHFQYECPIRYNGAHFVEIEEKNEVILGVQTICVEKEVCSQAWTLSSHIMSSLGTITNRWLVGKEQ